MAVIVLCLFLTELWASLQCRIVAFSGHTLLLFGFGFVESCPLEPCFCYTCMLTTKANIRLCRCLAWYIPLLIAMWNVIFHIHKCLILINLYTFWSYLDVNSEDRLSCINVYLA